MGVTGDDRVEGRVLEVVDEADDRPLPGRARRVADRVRAEGVPSWMSRTWTLTPAFLSRLDSARIRPSSGRKVRPSVAPAETSSGVVSSSAPMTPTLVPLTVKTLDGVTQSGRLPGRRLDDVDGEEREVGVGLVHQQAVDAVVELVVAVRGRVEAPQVLDVDRRLVLEQARVRGRGADVVAAGQDQTRAGQARQLLVEQRRELAGTADGHGLAVDGRRRLVELAVEVVEPDDRDGLVAAPPLITSSRTRPWLNCGSGMPSRNASVGARSIDRGVRPCPWRSPSPPARNVARMLVELARSWTSGT